MAMRHFATRARTRGIFSRNLRLPRAFCHDRGFSSEQSGSRIDQSELSMNTNPLDTVPEISLEPLTSTWPPDLVIHGIEWLHDIGGLEWFQAIALSTFATRLLLVPLAVRMMKGASKLSRASPEVQELSAALKEQKLSTDQYATQVKAVYAKHGIANPFAPILTPFLQFPIFISFFVGLRRLPEYCDVSTGGMAWFTDLSVPDPYYILPVTTAFGFLMAFELNADGTRNAAMPQMTYVMRFMAAAMIPLTATFPAALLVYWNVSNFFSLGQVAVLKIPGLKDRLGILPPLALPTARTASLFPSLDASEPSLSSSIKVEPTVSTPPPVMSTSSARTLNAPAKQKRGRKKRRTARRR